MNKQNYIMNDPLINQLSLSPATIITNNNQNNNNNNELSLLLPLSIPLRCRKSKRDVIEMSQGKPGILIKPKLNPLEGDKSLRLGHGQWYKKDSSSIHVIPKVSIIKKYQYKQQKSDDSNNDNNNIIIILLKIKNPTLSKIKLRLNKSNYKGEDSNNSNDNDDKSSINFIDNLLVDVITNKHIDMCLTTTTTTTTSSTGKEKENEKEQEVSSSTMETSTFFQPTEFIELDQVTDTLLELGTLLQNNEPEQIQNWNGQIILNDEILKQKEEATTSNNENNNISNIKFIAKQNDTAWFQLIIDMKKKKTQNQQQEEDLSLDDVIKKQYPNVPLINNGNGNNSNSNNNIYDAIPICMDIQVGNGSWESSLIKPKKNNTESDNDNDNIDYVSFDLVVTWLSN